MKQYRLYREACLSVLDQVRERLKDFPQRQKAREAKRKELRNRTPQPAEASQSSFFEENMSQPIHVHLTKTEDDVQTLSIKLSWNKGEVSKEAEMRIWKAVGALFGEILSDEQKDQMLKAINEQMEKNGVKAK